MNEGLRNFRKPTKQLEALKYISTLSDGLVFIACNSNEIIGYVAFTKPEFPRWAKAAKEIPELIELGGIEVSLAYRDEGIGKGILKWTFNNYDFEDRIIISIETVCNWNSKDPETSVWEYRNMVRSVLGSIGLEPRSTDDPEIRSHPGNILSARIGKRVSAQSQKKFEKYLKLKR
ncbi:GNAT family N-acetyltransferase [Natranaerofaba carboxydovora]|uniref:GNAT family N-acetyltransferase n=1 Tax=Natranaerofaba carboxydovora TaxID=2742683 RepID=UPI001F13C250|nr:GNAT family N-acetyltransferase [Natranaerofaba carboxydovora]